jgi:hypothetical protein
MKIFVSLVATTSLLIAGSSAAGKSARVENTASKPCISSAVSVVGYLHASRHGSWISDNPGINGRGMPITAGSGDFPGRKRTMRYVFRPQENMSSSFHALFSGRTICNEHGVTVLNLRKVEHIRVTQIRDAD